MELLNTILISKVYLLRAILSRYGFIDEAAAQRQLSAALLATSRERDERRHGTATKNRAQPRGRASGVRCKAMLGGVVENRGTNTPNIDVSIDDYFSETLLRIQMLLQVLLQTITS